MKNECVKKTKEFIFNLQAYVARVARDDTSFRKEILEDVRQSLADSIKACSEGV